MDDYAVRTFPEKVTKKDLQQMYQMPEKMLRPILNHYIESLGKNKRCRIIPIEVVIMIIRDLGRPAYYTLSEEMKEKVFKISPTTVKTLS